MPKRKMENSDGDSGGWVVTFTNLMILLLAFFVVLVTTSAPDEEKKMAGLGSLFGAFGLKPYGLTAIGSDSGSEITMGDAPMTKKNIDYVKFRNILFANGLISDASILKEAKRIVIALNNKVLFDVGSSEISKDGAKFLKDLSGVLMKGTGLIELRGYADYSENPFDPDPLKAIYYLSIKRALATLHFCRKEGNIPLHRIVAHGFSSPPIKTGSPKQKSEWRRQVEIILDYPQELPYKIRAHRQRKSFLDYKGFFFKLYGDHDE